MKYQVGEDVAVDFIGRIKKIEECYDGKIKYTVETEREMCIVMENCISTLPVPEVK